MLYKLLFGKEDLRVADTLEHLGNMYGRECDYDKYIVQLEESLYIRINILGPDNVIIAPVFYTLGSIFEKRQEYDTSIKAYSYCLSYQCY